MSLKAVILIEYFTCVVFYLMFVLFSTSVSYINIAIMRLGPVLRPGPFSVDSQSHNSVKRLL